jgi:uncharacterized membrane protein
MATRQTTRKSARRAPARAKATGNTRAGKGAKAAPAVTGKPARSTSIASSRQGAQSSAPSLLGRAVTGAQPGWRGIVRWADRAVTGAHAGWRRVVRWAGGGFFLTTLIVSVLGLGDAAYLTYQHFSQAATFAGCAEHGAINCEAVTTSPWSYLFGSHWLPVSALGLAFFAFMTAINSPWGWRARWPAVHWARLSAVVVGMVFVLYLIWAELFRVNAICLYCTGVHVLTFILFALIVGRATFSGVKAVPNTD